MGVRARGVRVKNGVGNVAGGERRAGVREERWRAREE